MDIAPPNLVGLLVSHSNDRSDATSRAPMAFKRYATGVHDGDKIVQNAIRHVFVKNAFVAKFLQIELQAFQLNTLLIRHVSKNERSEIGLAGLGTHRREFGALNLDMVFSIWKGIIETLELILKRCAWHSFFS